MDKRRDLVVRAGEVEMSDVKIKPLVWVDESRDDYKHFETRGLYGEKYYLSDYRDGSWGWFTTFVTEKGYSGCQEKGLTLEDAKAAAQADFERRIRECLE